MFWNVEKREMLKRNVLFQQEDADSYVGSMLGVSGGGGAAR